MTSHPGSWRRAWRIRRGHGSATAKKANAKASHEGKSNPRTSSTAQAKLGKKGGKGK